MKAIRVIIEEIEEGKPSKMLFQQFTEAKDGQSRKVAQRILNKAVEWFAEPQKSAADVQRRQHSQIA